MVTGPLCVTIKQYISGTVTYGEAQVVQPANLVLQVRLLHVADGVPDARQPVGNESKDAHEQHEDSGAVL